MQSSNRQLHYKPVLGECHYKPVICEPHYIKPVQKVCISEFHYKYSDISNQIGNIKPEFARVCKSLYII